MLKALREQNRIVGNNRVKYDAIPKLWDVDTTPYGAAKIPGLIKEILQKKSVKVKSIKPYSNREAITWEVDVIVPGNWTLDQMDATLTDHLKEAARPYFNQNLVGYGLEGLTTVNPKEQGPDDPIYIIEGYNADLGPGKRPSKLSSLEVKFFVCYWAE